MKAYIVTKNSLATNARKDCYGDVYGIIPVNVRKSFIKNSKIPGYKYIHGSFLNVEGHEGKNNIFRNRFGKIWICLNGERIEISTIRVERKEMPSVYLTKQDALMKLQAITEFSLAIANDYD